MNNGNVEMRWLRKRTIIAGQPEPRLQMRALAVIPLGPGEFYSEWSEWADVSVVFEQERTEG